MIKLENISLAFGEQIVFDDVSCNFAPHQKIGLVGRNGSGKSTLLKAMAGHQHIDSGKIYVPKSFNCAFMPQDVVLISQKNILQEALGAFEGLERLLEQKENIEALLRANDKDDETFAQYAHVHQELHEAEYEDKCAQAKKC